MKTQLRRLGASVAGGALAITALSTLGTAPAQAEPQVDITGWMLAGDWLLSNLQEDGLLHTASEWEGQTFSGPSYGTTIDLAFALDTYDNYFDANEAAITDAIATNLAAYTTYEDAVYSGSSAKALALAVAQGRDATAFGGVDLQARVEGLVSTDPEIAGRLQDADPTPDQYWADYANTIGQAFAARALSDLDSASAPAVVDYLLDQQCTGAGQGFFRLYFPAADAADQTCDGASPAEPAEQAADTTALVILQLAPLAADNPEIAAAVQSAATWLAAQQRADGGFADPDTGVNTNTTGLAGWALKEAGQDAAAAKASVWVRSRQVLGTCEVKLSRETGAIAYNDEALAAGRRYGIADPLDRSQWLIADVQALPVLDNGPYAAGRLKIVGPKFAQAGKSVKVTISGMPEGYRGCVRASTAVTHVVSKSSASFTVTAKTIKANQPITVKAPWGTAWASTKVLGAKKLKPVTKKTLKRGTKQSVKVKGLAKGETVVVKLGGKKVATGKANAKGVFTAKIKVKAKKGKAKLIVTGQFKNRAGTKKVIVK
ncbi:hypothetical protein ACLM5J_06040 [Nocardioides sp. Bht2]|uniref:hypothetical protein n=1 Tax=Nocardioides sp. Bht2 TaxID=3392297 RepID=UPI0039B4F76F